MICCVANYVNQGAYIGQQNGTVFNFETALRQIFGSFVHEASIQNVLQADPCQPKRGTHNEHHVAAILIENYCLAMPLFFPAIPAVRGNSYQGRSCGQRGGVAFETPTQIRLPPITSIADKGFASFDSAVLNGPLSRFALLQVNRFSLQKEPRKSGVVSPS